MVRNSKPTRLRSSSSALIRSRRRVIDRLQLQQVVPGGAEGGAAGLADVDADLAVVVVAARSQTRDLGADDLAGRAAVPAARQADPGHLVAGALVVDQRTGAELADRQEPGPLQPGCCPGRGCPGMNAASGRRGNE